MPRVKNVEPRPAASRKVSKPAPAPAPEPEPPPSEPNRFDLAIEQWAEKARAEHRRTITQLDRAEAIYRALDIATLTGADPALIVPHLGPNLAIPQCEATAALRAEVEAGRLEAVDQADLMAVYLEASALEPGLTVPEFLARYADDAGDPSPAFYESGDDEEDEDASEPEPPPKPKAAKAPAFAVGDGVLYRPPGGKTAVRGIVTVINKTGTLVHFEDEDGAPWSNVSSKYLTLIEDEDDTEDDTEDEDAEEVEVEVTVAAAPPKAAGNGKAVKAGKTARASDPPVAPAPPRGVTVVTIEVPHKAAEKIDRILRERKPVKGSPLGDTIRPHSYAKPDGDLTFLAELVNDEPPYVEVFCRKGSASEPCAVADPAGDSILGVYTLQVRKQVYEVHVAAV